MGVQDRKFADKQQMTAFRAVKALVARFSVNGVDPVRLASGVLHIPRFLADMVRYASRNGGKHFPLRFRNLYPCLSDYSDSSGVAKGHYFHQDLYVARLIQQARPGRHMDVGSRIDGFIAHLLTFMPVEVIDVRRLESRIPGLSFTQADATKMTGISDNSVPSLSSLHAAEHFGLGRYGDPIDPQACFRFMAALERVLAPGGRLYFSVPIGRQRLEFNAQRVFAPATIPAAFPSLKLVSFAAVLDDGDLYTDITPDQTAASHFACGLFEFTKLP